MLCRNGRKKTPEINPQDTKTPRLSPWDFCWKKVVNVKQKTLRWNVHGKCYDIYQNYYITFRMFLPIFLWFYFWLFHKKGLWHTVRSKRITWNCFSAIHVLYFSQDEGSVWAVLAAIVAVLTLPKQGLFCCLRYWLYTKTAPTRNPHGCLIF